MSLQAYSTKKGTEPAERITGRVGWIEKSPGGEREEHVFNHPPGEKEAAPIWIPIADYRSKKEIVRMNNIEYYAKHPELVALKKREKSGRFRLRPPVVVAWAGAHA